MMPRKSTRRKANKTDIVNLLNDVFGKRNAAHVFGVFGFATLASTLNNKTSGDLVVDGGWKPSAEAKWYRLAAERGIGRRNSEGGAL